MYCNYYSQKTIATVFVASPSNSCVEVTVTLSQIHNGSVTVIRHVRSNSLPTQTQFRCRALNNFAHILLSLPAPFQKQNIYWECLQKRQC